MTRALSNTVLWLLIGSGCNILSAQRLEFLAINKNRCCRYLTCTRQTDPNIRMFTFSGTIDYTAHHGDSYLFGHAFQTFSYLFCQCDNVDLTAAAGGTNDQFRSRM